jgi:uncharacterized protein YndB with AHSA1/START domain
METITVSTNVKAPREKVWELWTRPEHITQWYFASDDWHAPRAENDLHIGGRFTTRMEAKDKSAGFDFGGTYTEVLPHERLGYTLDDGRKVTVTFKDKDGGTEVTEAFETEDENPIEMQRGGWQSILDNFRKYVERE